MGLLNGHAASARARRLRGPAMLAVCIAGWLLAGCSRDFSSPYLPTSPEFAGSAWTQDHDGNGVADSVEKYAPGCSNAPSSCLAIALAQAGATGNPADTSHHGVILVQSVSAPDLRLAVGETRPADVKLLPENATSRNYELSSQNGNVAVVRPSGIYGAGLGTAIVTVHALDGSDKIGQFQVTVVSAAVKVEAKNLTVKTDAGAVAPDLAFSPPEASATDYVLTGGDPVIAVVTADRKHLEPVGPGKTSFKVQVPDNAAVWDTFNVTVQAAKVPVEAAQAEDISFSLINPGDPLRKKPAIAWTPANATDQGYTLASANPRIAKVVGDSVEAGITGRTTITLVTKDGGFRSTFKVTVSLLDICTGECDDKGKGKG
jgi:hypothetical protein